MSNAKRDRGNNPHDIKDRRGDLFWKIWGKVTPTLVVAFLVFGFTFWFFYMDRVQEYLYMSAYYDELSYFSWGTGKVDPGLVNFISHQASRYCDLYKVYRMGFLPDQREKYDLHCEAVQNWSTMIMANCKLDIDAQVRIPTGAEWNKIRDIKKEILKSGGGSFSFGPMFFREGDLNAYRCD